MQQVLITLPDGSQVIVQGQMADPRVMTRKSPGACWEPAMANKRPHEPNGIHVGEY